VYWYGNKNHCTKGHIWDAGPTGGVTFNGDWIHIWGPSSGLMPEIVTLRGENTLPCIIAGSWIGDTETAATYIKKRGSGTWRFADNSERKMMGGIAVEEGVLQFDSIAETNENCSLGLATSLQLPYHAAYDESKNVDYAYLLGTKNTVGTMEYTGTTVARCKTRPFAVNGRGVINNASVLNLQLENAFAGTSSDSILVLSAVENSVSNMFKRISDGSYGGKLSVEKQGKGSWMLKGAQTFSGSLSVKEGSLVIQNLPYSWFKLVIKEKNSNIADNNIGLQEIALYDSEGYRCNSNVTFVSSSTTSNSQRLSPADWRNLNVNEAAWDINGFYWNYNDRDGDKLLDDKYTPSGCCIVRYPTLTGNAASIELTNPKTWLSFVQRLDPTKSLACAFDILALYTPNSSVTAHARIPITYSFEASSDGVLWDEVYKANKVATPEAEHWYSDSSEFVKGAVRKGKGFSFINEVIPADDVLANCSSISVSSGATLEAQGNVSLRTLSLDASENGNGTIKGFAFAKTGEIFIENMVGTGAKKINVVFDSCSDAANIEGWTLAVNGQVTTSYGAYLTDGGISLVPNGTVIIVR
jgi:autotransporter-associated beta strand protein